MEEVDQITYFHLPGSRLYKPGAQGQGGYGGSMPGWLALPNGTTVTLHGVEGQYRVVRSHFHWGQPDEETGMHIFLKRLTSARKARPSRVIKSRPL